MANGGAENAVQVCAVRAPAIAQELATKTSWFVSRVSLKPRNRDNDIADAWKHAVLAQFDQRQTSGEPGSTINTSAFIDGDYRFMQAQPAVSYMSSHTYVTKNSVGT